MIGRFDGDINYIIKGYNYEDNDYLLVSVSVEHGEITDETINGLRQYKGNTFIFDYSELQPHISDIYIEVDGKVERLQSQYVLEQFINERKIPDVHLDDKLKRIYMQIK